jgi:hypothetical protein
MPDIKRVTKRLEIYCDKSLEDLRADQARVAADRWINQHEQNEDVYAWEFSTAYVSLQEH